MRYKDDKLRERLASEYVLGTLQGGARRRFERLLKEDAALRAVVDSWQERLNPLAEALPPEEPPARVWREIARRTAPPRKERSGLWYSIGFWRSLGTAASAVAVMLALYIGLLPTPTPAPTYIVVLVNEQAQAAWVLSADLGSKRVTVQTLRPQAVPIDKAFELWLLPGVGHKPRSLGLIPVTGNVTLPLPEQAASELSKGRGFAVSQEPAGGSPTGLPTGPVLFQGQALSL